MKALHGKNVKKAKEKLKAADTGKVTYDSLDKPAQNMLQKRMKAGHKPPAQHPHEPHKKAAEA